MLLRDLFESANGTRTLYRGDASKIESFDSEITRRSIGQSLFGMGIYLTDNPRVALDYTVKGAYRRDGSGTVVVHDEDTLEDAIRFYLNKVMVRELGWVEHRDKLKDQWFWKWQEMMRGTSRPDAPRTWAKEEPSEEWLAYKAKEDGFQEEFRTAIKTEMAKFLKKAKAIYKQRKLRVFQDTSGKWSVMSDQHEGALSTFEVPEEYLRATLHGDRPLTDRELKIIREYVYQITKGTGLMDLRNKNYEFGGAFDDWIELFRKEGTIYAWHDTLVGGEGKNPSLDQLWNGTHGGYTVFNTHMDDFIAHMKSHGYHGIEYDGGTRLGANVRGGGGIRHQSFVLWDDAYVNSCRVENAGVEYDPANLPMQKIRSQTMYKKFRSPDKHGYF